MAKPDFGAFLPKGYQSPIAPLIDQYHPAVRGPVGDMDDIRSRVLSRAVVTLRGEGRRGENITFSHARGIADEPVVRRQSGSRVLLEGSEARVLGDNPDYGKLGKEYKVLDPFDAALSLRRPHLIREAGRDAQPTLIWMQNTGIAVARPNGFAGVEETMPRNGELYPATVFFDPRSEESSGIEVGINPDGEGMTDPVPLETFTSHPDRLVTMAINDMRAAIILLREVAWGGPGSIQPVRTRIF